MGKQKKNEKENISDKRQKLLDLAYPEGVEASTTHCSERLNRCRALVRREVN